MPMTNRTNPPTMIALEGYREGPPPSFWGIFATAEDREAHLDHMLANHEFNYYLLWKDTQGYGLEGAWATWVGEGRPYIAR